MPIQRANRYPSSGSAPTSPNSKPAPVLGIGSRVLVASRNGRSGHVTLTDDNGTSAVATVADGVEVEILAWRPRRGGETRYRVVSTSGGVEGWLGATSLRPRQPAPSPTIVRVPAPRRGAR
jgi:hypothetical protein